LIDKRLRQRDLKLAGHLCHGLIVSPIKDRVKDLALIRRLTSPKSSKSFALGFWRMSTRMPTIQFQCQQTRRGIPTVAPRCLRRMHTSSGEALRSNVDASIEGKLALSDLASVL
jgi:hypothetical protein